MKKLIFRSKLIMILLCAYTFVEAQKQDPIWVFADSSGTYQLQLLSVKSVVMKKIVKTE